MHKHDRGCSTLLLRAGGRLGHPDVVAMFNTHACSALIVSVWNLHWHLNMRYLHYASLIAIWEKRLPAPRIPAPGYGSNRRAAGTRKRGYASCASAAPI